MTLQARDVLPVSFGFTPPGNGWVGLDIGVGDRSDHVNCSDVYDPFPELADWARQLVHGLQGCVEIDEEGIATQLWLTREPGSYLGRFRVFEPGAAGQVEVMHIDATVDVVQLAQAYHAAFSTLVATHDPEGWSGRGVTTPMAGIDLRWLAASLHALGVLEYPEARGLHDASRTSRERYEAELGDKALPCLPGGAEG